MPQRGNACACQTWAATRWVELVDVDVRRDADFGADLEARGAAEAELHTADADRLDVGVVELADVGAHHAEPATHIRTDVDGCVTEVANRDDEGGFEPDEVDAVGTEVVTREPEVRLQTHAVVHP